SRINVNLTTICNTNCVFWKNCFITRTMSNPDILQN
ncbi:Type III restriction enzyme, res subunit, partial [Haemophilus influenzae]